MASSGLRIHLVEPSIGVVFGGTRIVVHGRGFRPLPHSLLVRFRLAETNTRLDVAGRFLLETQLECVVPSFMDDARKVIARRTNLAPASATVMLAPHLVSVQVEVILDSDRVSNALSFQLHQEIVVAKILPQFVLMTPSTTVTVTLNLLKLAGSSRLFLPNVSDTRSGGNKPLDLADVSSMPVFVRVRQVSERTGALSERTVEGRWSISPVGVYEVEFEAVMMTFGDAVVEITLNRQEFFRSNGKALDALGYCVQRDVALSSVDPCCISVTSGRSTEVRVLGEGFADTGDLTVCLLQMDIQEAVLFESKQSEYAGLFHPVAQLSATYFSPTEIRCTVHPNMPFGLTRFQVSLNGGRQYGKEHATALLHRDRNVESITPCFASVEGNTFVMIRLARLPVDAVDAPRQIRNLTPPRRARVRFEAVGLEVGEAMPLVKTISADVLPSNAQSSLGESDESTTIQCRVPSFLDDIKQIRQPACGDIEARPVIDFGGVQQFRVSVSLGGEGYFGSLQFGLFCPPVILSMNKHHGPCSGGTMIVLRMKHPVPPKLAIQVRFISLAKREFKCVPAFVGSEYFSRHQGHPNINLQTSSQTRGDQEDRDNQASLIVCSSPAWDASTPVLTKVQISLDGGFNFIPLDEEHELNAAGLGSPRSRSIPAQLVRDMSHLYFLFYPVPRLFSVTPMSADIQGGSFIRISGEHVVDHGGQVCVVFQSSRLSRKVVGFVENGELRCCVPPFDVGPAVIFVSLNGDQYTRCEFIDPDSRRRIEFVYYSSPLLQRLSPLSACISHSSLIRIFGVNLIETGRVKVRFGFINSSGKLVYKDVSGRAEDGIIIAQSPLFGVDFGNLKAVVDVALNGNDFSGKTLSLYYYDSFSIKRVEPAVGAVDIPIPLAVSVSQSIISDTLLVRVRFKQRSAQKDAVFGPATVTRWEGTKVNFVLPAISEYISSLQDFVSACIDISFDHSYFCEIGNLLDFYQPYKLPSVISINPLVGHFEHETRVVAQCSDVQDTELVTITLTMINTGHRLLQEEIKTVPTTVNAKKQTLTWYCPPLSCFSASEIAKMVQGEKSMLLQMKLAMQVSTVDGQLLALPFEFQYYRAPTLLSMNPQVGYVCGGSLVSFQFNESIETPTVDIRFGTTEITCGRVREDDKRFVECLSPALESGVHTISMSFDEQYFEEFYWTPQTQNLGDDDYEEKITRCQQGYGRHAHLPDGKSPIQQTQERAKCIFQAFSMPHFATPHNRNLLNGFGSVDGGSYVYIKGSGFIPEGKIYVRFDSTTRGSFLGSTGAQSEVVVKARVLDEHTILCVSPPATKTGRVSLQVTYNLQQYTDTSGYFEYHEPTTFRSRGILCGPVSGGTPVCIQVVDPAGLPEDKSLLRSSCMLRFSNDKGYSRDVNATFDECDSTIQCIAPSWPSNELVSLAATMTKDTDLVVSLQQFIATNVRFLFYDPPEGLITIEPSAGPVTGGTEVFAWCGKMVDTGEIMVSVAMIEDSDKDKKLASVGEEEEYEGENKQDVDEHDAISTMDREIYLIRGKIIGEAVTFRTPAVSKPGVAYLSIALNGINYTSTQSTTLRFKYYVDPLIRRISPTWCPADTSSIVTISGDFFEDHGCRPVVRFQLQQSQCANDTYAESIVVEGSFVDMSSEPKSIAACTRALQCTFQAPCAGSFEVEVSLNNGQQFSRSKYMAAGFANYSGSACTALLPFRCFLSPFFLATPTGSVAGGSTVTLFMSAKLSKLLSRETKCQVHFLPTKNNDGGATNTGVSQSASSHHKTSSTASSDGVAVAGDIDHTDLKITCKAPLLRVACVAAIDLLLPTYAASAASSDFLSSIPAKPSSFASSVCLSSCSAAFGTKEREKFRAYESPTITDLAPSCGPLSGGTWVVIECTNIIDTGQIFVRFRSSANERECMLVPATFCRTFPDGSPSSSPLLLCRTPQVEVIERIIFSVSEPVTSSSPPSPSRGSTSREGSTAAMTAKARAHSFQQMAELSLRRGSQNILRVTRAVVKNATAPSIGCTISVLVDFTMNAGEQFIAHSVPFHFYPVIDPQDINWTPRHVPTQCFDRSTPTETRKLTIRLPKSLRSFADSASAGERAAICFEGSPQQIFSSVQKRRSSSIVLHETGDARELIVLDTPPPTKLRKETTMRRRSTYFRNSSISATSNNLLDSSGASLASRSSRTRSVKYVGGSRRPSGTSFGTENVQSLHTTITDNGRQTSQTIKLPTHTSGPYFAAKVIKNGLEITCPIPEFNTSGSVQVHFSFNAQQFVCLGELFIHEPIDIRADRHLRYTPNIGGDRFVLYCSPSSVFKYLPSRDVLTETRVRDFHQSDMPVTKSSRAFQSSTRSGICNNSFATEGASAWRNRVFFSLNVHVIPPNIRLLRQVVVTVHSRGNKTALATSSPDESGRCVFEASDWSSDVMVIAVAQPSAGWSSFSSLISPYQLPTRLFTSDKPKTEGMDAVIVKLPTAPYEVKACAFGHPSVVNSLVIVNAAGEVVTNGIERSCNMDNTFTLDFDPVSALYDKAQLDAWFICLDIRVHDSSEVHVVIVNASGGQMYLTASLESCGVWIVALVLPQPGEISNLVEVDRHIERLSKISTDESVRGLLNGQASSNTIDYSQTAFAPVQTQVQFACADSSRYLSVSVAAQIVLPSDQTIDTLLSATSDHQIQNRVLLQCEMPVLPFNGPTVLSLLVDGVTFSNSLCVHCYDPRIWRITSLDPPCALVNANLRLRVKGEHFVDNKKTIIRLSNATQYQDIQATMEDYRLLIVRVAAVRNFRHLLLPFISSGASINPNGGIGVSAQRAQQQSLQVRDEAIYSPASLPIICVVEYRDQVFRTTARESTFFTTLSHSPHPPNVGWEDQFEVQISSEAVPSALVLITLVLLETGENRQWELGRVIVPTAGLLEATLTKRTFILQEQFRWRNGSASTGCSSPSSEVDVFLHLSPLMTNPEIFVCDIPPFAIPQQLRIQISSGDSFFSPCPELTGPNQSEVAVGEQGDSYKPVFRTYILPVVTETKPRVLSRTAGGEITIFGEGFVSDGDSNRICVRLFGYRGANPNPALEHDFLEQINALQSSQSGSASHFFIRDIRATFVSSTTLNLIIPPRLATYRLYYRVSVDDSLHFSLATPLSQVMLYSADFVEPKGGPVSGNTYVSVQGTNLHACMSLGNMTPVVKLTWMRGIKELESIMVRGEFYPPEDVVYFYTPQSKFGLQNITVLVEVALVSNSELPSAPPANASIAVPALTSIRAMFGQDEVPFVVYRTPIIKSISPLQSLVLGVSLIDIIVQGLDEKAVLLMKTSIKARFKRRGQVQIAEVHVGSVPGSNSDWKMSTVVPRFIVGSAVATEIISAVATSSPTRQIKPTPRSFGDPKIWTRQGGIFVLVFRARNLYIAKKSSNCNPFVVIHCNKAQLKSTRKDGTSAPVWNELFDFDWRGEKNLPHSIRLSVENQLTSNQSELIGQVSIAFKNVCDLSRSFCVRMWIPLRRRTARGEVVEDMCNSARATVGEIEVAIAFVPLPMKKISPKFLQAAALKSSIMSAMQQKKKAGVTTSSAQTNETQRARKDRLLRAFRRRGAPSSLIPSEVAVELAVNGQDFWSSAPSRCLLVPTPIVLAAEPSFICLSGGTLLTVTGMNFTQDGVHRVAFAVGESLGSTASDLGLSQPLLEGKNIATVDAKYRSTQCITCVTPSLLALGATESSVISLYVSANGLDFDSISLPAHGTVATVEAQSCSAPVSEIAANDGPAHILGMVGDQCIIDTEAISTHFSTPSSVGVSLTLVHRVRVYLQPAIRKVRPADGIYTSSLVIEGDNFSNTGLTVARYCSKSDARDVRVCPVNVISSQLMECTMPDFPRGTIVTVSIAMNGVEFVACPGELAVFQLPRLTRIVPSWISTVSEAKQDVRISGVNLTAQASASGTVHVSFQSENTRNIIKGQCVDGEVLCTVPRELIAALANEQEDFAKKPFFPSIFVDVWLGGTHKAFTGQPLKLQLHNSAPSVITVTPTNGPIYGGYRIVIEGRDFIDTGHIVARFQAVVYASGEDTNSRSSNIGDNCCSLQSSHAAYADTSAKFVSDTTIECMAPAFPQEGVFSVSISLNGVDFSATNTLSCSWFLAWQNWQRRKQLAAQRISLEAALTAAVRDSVTDSTLAVLPATPSSAIVPRPPSSSRSSTVETAFGRRVSSQSKQRSSRLSADQVEVACADSPRQRKPHDQLSRLVEDENSEHLEDKFVDVRLLQWHPATTEDTGVSLTTLLIDLFNAPDTQQIMIRRIGFVFRTYGSLDSSSGHYIIRNLVSFTNGFKLIFPNATEKHFEELWRALDTSQLGYVSLRTITKCFVVAESLRPHSPEPGPTHYFPNFTLVEPKPPTTLILPQSSAAAQDLGLTSELFMDYDAFKVVRPRVLGGRFLKREPAASWCNPVPKDVLFRAEMDEDIERAFAKQREHRDNATARLETLATAKRSSLPDIKQDGVLSKQSRWRPSLLGERKTDARGEGGEIPLERRGGVGRGTRLSRASFSSESSLIDKPNSPRIASATASTATEHHSSTRRNRSILHNDIAPLYLKFLRSKEVQNDTDFNE